MCECYGSIKHYEVSFKAAIEVVGWGQVMNVVITELNSMFLYSVHIVYCLVIYEFLYSITQYVP